MSQGSLQEFRSTVFYSFSSSCLTQKGVNYMQDIDPPEIELWDDQGIIRSYVILYR